MTDLAQPALRSHVGHDAESFRIRRNARAALRNYLERVRMRDDVEARALDRPHDEVCDHLGFDSPDDSLRSSAESSCFGRRRFA